MKHRVEKDPLGQVRVPAHAYYGVQTQRALENFPISGLTAPPELVTATVLIKKAAAETNRDLGRLDGTIADAIGTAADEVLAGGLRDQFVVDVYQAGAGTSHNMNTNEVLANRAAELLGGTRGGYSRVHPNDHVNMGQSTNDVFPTATRLALLAMLPDLLAAGHELTEGLEEKSREFSHVLKTGRTHLQDATPVTLGQEIGAWASQVTFGLQAVRHASEGLLDLAIGGTAVGTGLNAHPAFGGMVASRLSALTGHAFREAPDRFFALAAHDALVQVSAALRTLAGGLMKMANDIRWLASGPRCGIGELVLPANEPGSSIMPGKVNPTQSEALTMVCVQVFGNDAAVAFAGSQGNFQLNVYKPVMLHNVLESTELLADACLSFTEHCVAGLQPDEARITEHLERNLMLVTALAPHIGYDNAASIAKTAHRDGLTLREAALASGLVTDDQFNTWVDPLAMTRPTAD